MTATAIANENGKPVGRKSLYMKMIKSVINYPVSQFFDIEADIVHVLPCYQREYTWSKKQ